MEYLINGLITISFLFVIYGIYVIIITRMDIKNIKSEYLTEMVVEEINKRNLETIRDIEKNLKADSIIYIDGQFNKINNRLNKRIEQLNRR